jgi:transposase-like protein
MNIIQVYKQFPTQDDCLAHIENVKWAGKPKCPYCNSLRVTALPKEHRYHCNACNTSFSVTVRTIFHKTRIDLQRWFLAIALVLNARKGISARQLARDIEVNKNTAWLMLMRIRKAMVEYGDLLEGIIETDETYIGGKNRNKHMDKRIKGVQGRSTKDKTPVFGMLNRGGEVRAQKVGKVNARTLQAIIKANVKVGSEIMTDEWGAYTGLERKKFKHTKVNHGRGQYVIGDAHTNSIENFWSLLKRGIIGQYHHVTDRHLNAYINEFCFRYNKRNEDGIFDTLILKAVTVK